jgi:YidC/Oxa1 family membrane protein insertase
MKEIEPELAAIKERVTDKVEQNKEIYALYKERKINPFSSCLLVLIQIPIIVALYLVFLRGFSGEAHVALYSFIKAPTGLNMEFLGLIDLRSKSIILAVLAGATQFIQAKLIQGRQAKPKGGGMQAQLAKSMQMQMLYILPIMIVFIAYKVAAAVALYWITSNIFTIGQELYTARKIRAKAKNA